MIPSIERLREIFHYEPETGKLFWKLSPNRRIKAGSEAGATTPKGYRVVGVDGVQFYVHQVAWAISTGEWPGDEIDHISRKGHDNTFNNLRRPGRSGNVRNTVRTNKTGFRGVYKHKTQERFAARIIVDGKAKHLGWFVSAKQAGRAYDRALISHFGSTFPTNASLGLL